MDHRPQSIIYGLMRSLFYCRGEDIKSVVDLCVVHNQWRDPADDIIVCTAREQEQAAFLAGVDDSFGDGLVRRFPFYGELGADHQSQGRAHRQ